MKKRKPRARQKPYTPPVPQKVGDHGTGTQAATANTVLEKQDGPNNVYRRRREEAIDRFDLTMRQKQAAVLIRNAYCRVEMLTSGGPLREKVDGSPKPDAVVAAQVGAQSQLVRLMRAVPSEARKVVEHVCWHNLPVSGLPGQAETHSAMLKAALDRVADRIDQIKPATKGGQI